MYYIEEFLQSLKESQLKYSTISLYKKLLAAFTDYFTQKGIEDVKEISKKAVLKFIEKLAGNREISFAHRIRILRLKKYFSFLEENEYIFLSPLKDYPLPDSIKKHYPLIDKDVLNKVLTEINPADPESIKGKAIIELAYSSALRPGEIYNLKISDINFDAGLIFIEKSKRNKDRIVPVGKTALYWINRYLKEVRPRYLRDNTHKFVFINHRGGTKLTVYGVRAAIKSLLKKNDIEPFTTYSIRVTAATDLLLNGMGIVYISKLLGHSDIRTTKSYLHINLKNLKAEMRTKHPREKMKINNKINKPEESK